MVVKQLGSQTYPPGMYLGQPGPVAYQPDHRIYTLVFFHRRYCRCLLLNSVVLCKVNIILFYIKVLQLLHTRLHRTWGHRGRRIPGPGMTLQSSETLSR